MATRTEELDRLGRESWDVLVVGGGATGLGTAVDAAARGYRTALVEAGDFARGTSSRSTKLIHGGVRYLAQGNLALVREALRERGLLLRNAPHLVHDRPFLVPSYQWWGRPYYGIGLWLYDRLAGSLGLGATRTVGAEQARRLVPTLEPAGLRGGVVYHDGQFDDARLAISLMRTVEDLGGLPLNHAEVTALTKGPDGRVTGALVRDGETGVEVNVRAKVVVNATGVFADALRRLDEPAAAPMIRPSQGAHVVLDAAFLPGETALMVPKTDDGRVLFAIPWLGKVLVGTTDTPVDAVATEPRPLADEVEFLLRHAGRYLSRDPGPSDVLSAFAGLRPLLAPTNGGRGPTSRLSREHVVVASASGLVTITGGKWTTYRSMARTAVDLAARVAGLTDRPCTTERLKLHGAGPSPPDSGGRLASFGTDAEAVARLIAERPEWVEPLHPRLPYLKGEVVWSARHERALAVEDVLSRRTRALFLDACAANESASEVAGLLAAELGRDEAWQRGQVAAFESLTRGYLPGG